MPTIKNFIMKSKNERGQLETLYPKTCTENVITTEDIVVALNNPIGSIQNNEVIPSGTDINTIVKKMLQQRMPPTYQSPTISISVVSGNVTGTYEVGTDIETTIRSYVNIGDGGDISSHSIYKNNSSQKDEINTAIDLVAAFTLGDQNVTFNSSCTYGDGLVKNDNFGDPYPDTSIKAGTINSSKITFKPYRKYYYTIDNETVAPTTAAELKSFTGSTSGAYAGLTARLTIPAGSNRVVFAYPATIRDVSSVKYVEFNNDESKNFFTKSTIENVGAVNDFGPIQYKVYTFIPNQPTPALMTFDITI